MKLSVDEEKLKELDKYNLFRILELASIGNLTRCSVWTVNKLSEFWESLIEISEETKTKDKKKTNDEK